MILTAGRNAQMCCKRYTVYSIFKWSIVPGFKIGINNTISDAFLNKLLVLMELTFIRDGSFDIAGNGDFLYSRDEIICLLHKFVLLMFEYFLFFALSSAK